MQRNSYQSPKEFRRQTMEIQIKRRNRRRILIAVLLIVGFAVGYGIIDAISKGNNQSPALSCGAMNERYGEELSNICDLSIDGASWANLPGDDGQPLRMAVYNTGTCNGNSLHDSIPDSWRARSASDTDIVVCVGAVEVEYFCDYTDDAGTAMKTYYAALPLQSVRVFNAQTQQPITSSYFWGERPFAHSCAGVNDLNDENFEAYISSFR